MEIIALVPAFNEAQRIGETIEAITKIKQIKKIVVINDGSTDHTDEVVKSYQIEYPVELITFDTNRGKGQALNAGWNKFPADIYLLLDADLQESAFYATYLLPPVVNGEVDMTIANFVTEQIKDGQGKMGFGLAKSLAKSGIKLLTGHTTSSPLSGQRAVSNKLLKSCNGFAKGFGVEVDLTIKALRLGYKIIEIDVPMTHRATGRNLSGFLHRGKQLLVILKVLLQAWRNS